MSLSSVRDGLVAEYRFSGNADDTSGSARHGVIHGAKLTADRFERPDHAYQFDGIDDYIEVAPPPSFTSDLLSVSVWVRYEARDFSGWTNCIIAQDDGDDEDQSRRVFQLSADWGHLVWHRMIGARDPMCLRRVRTGRWYHVVGVHERGVNRLYVDGELQDSVEHKLWVHETQPMHIGRKGTPEPHFFFQGAIDDVLIYDRALNEEEISELLTEGGWSVTALPGLPIEGDPVTGQWGKSGVVFLDLEYDGDQRVTGRIMNGQPGNMAAIATGTFDRSRGELRLEGSAVDSKTGSLGPFVIAGVLDDGEISVLARFNDFAGNFTLTRDGTTLRPTSRSLRSHLESMVHRWRRFFGKPH